MRRPILNAILLLLLVWPLSGRAQIYHIDISGTIDLGLPPYIERIIAEAEANGARAVLLEVNTFGGRVDAATQIKDILLDSPVLTLAYVNKRAISAGALITLSCDSIGMTPGSSIGAATVVDQSGEKAAEKQISYFRAEMGATAEQNGRNRQIAEAMVDEEIEVPGLSEKGKLVTLTAEDALKWQMADYVAPTMDAFLDSLGLGDEEIVYSEITWAEHLVRFFTGPVVSSFLISLGLLGLFFEIKSPGWGIPGTLGVIFLALFFGSQYIINLASFLEIILFVTGVVLILVEIFVIPGFGIAGVSGIVCMIGALYLSLVGQFETLTTSDFTGAATRLFFALLLTVVGAVIIARLTPKTALWRGISLQPEQRRDEGYTVNVSYGEWLGKTGTAHTDLRPAGVGEFGDRRLDVISEGEYIEKDTPIKIVRVEGYRLVVKAQPAKRKTTRKPGGKKA